jgi:probable phosphoglycerate mutase
MKKIYYVRHGESESNLKEIFSGGIDNPNLTKKGREQAAAAGKTLKDKGIQLVVSSPLIRARDTAEIIAGEIGYDKNKIVFNDLLIERTFGYYESKPHALRAEHESSGKVEDVGESMPDLHARIKKALEWIRTLKEETILVVSHGGVGRMVRIIDGELSHEDFYEVKRFENCEVDQFTL